MSATPVSLLHPLLVKETAVPSLSLNPYSSTNPTVRNIRTSVQAVLSACAPEHVSSNLKEFTKGSTELHTLSFAHHALVVQMDSFNATERLLSKVKSPDTVLSMNRMLDNLSSVVQTPYAGALRNFLFEVFRHNADTCTYQTDYEEGEYTLLLHDAKSRTQITISIETLAYASAVKESQAEALAA